VLLPGAGDVTTGRLAACRAPRPLVRRRDEPLRRKPEWF